MLYEEVEFLGYVVTEESMYFTGLEKRAAILRIKPTETFKELKRFILQKIY